MTALLILNHDVIDEQRLCAYRRSAGEAILGPAGRLLASTSDTTGLGEGTTTGRRTVIIEYPSRQEAEARYRSVAYQALLPERLAATIPRTAFIVDLTEHSAGEAPMTTPPSEHELHDCPHTSGPREG